MNMVLSTFSPYMPSGIYLKDPLSSILGKNILKTSIDLIDELGFEDFTFRKLALELQSTEASIYRYFESKHKLLVYLTSYYWSVMEYALKLKNANIKCPLDQISNFVKLVAHAEPDINFECDMNTDMDHLFKIIYTESNKTYLIKSVDHLNEMGFYYNYKQMILQVSELVSQMNNKFKSPQMLISTVIEGIHHQVFFSVHLPSLSDGSESRKAIADFFIMLIKQTSGSPHESVNYLVQAAHSK